MPQDRKHGGAELTIAQLTVPGFKGLNTQAASSILGPEWATVLKNSVIDENNRLAARKGWYNQTTTPASQDFVQLAEYLTTAGVSKMFGTGATTCFASSDSGVTWSDVTGTASFTSGNWHLMMFNDVLVGFQAGENMLIFNGTTCSQSAATGLPTGGVGLSAFGRLWAVDSDGVTIKYCALLDHTDWNGSDAGQISVENVWQGSDSVQALAAFNGTLVVFGRDNIVIWTDGQGSNLGVDPLQLYVVDTLRGIGCRARDSVQNVNGDLWFLSEQGLQSLSRVIQEKSNPLTNLSSNIQDDLLLTMQESTLADCRAVFSPKERLYLLAFSRSSGTEEIGYTYAFDTRGQLDDRTVRCVGKWTGLVPPAVLRLQASGALYMAKRGQTGYVGTYDGRVDVGGEVPVTYDFEYQSGWIDLTQSGYLIIPKRINAVFFVDRSLTVTLKWAFDFNNSFTTQDLTFSNLAVVAEYNEAEYGEAEYGASVALLNSTAQGSGTGEYIKLGMEATIEDTLLSLQQIELFSKIGRYR